MGFVDHMKVEVEELLLEGVHEVGVEEGVGSCHLVHLLKGEQAGLQVVQELMQLFLPFHVFHSHNHQTGMHEGYWLG
jgi:hypothetical protein